MDDDKEEEIIYEIWITHLHLLWKYISVASSNLFVWSSIENIPKNMFQPLVFVSFTLFLILSSIIIQIKKEWLQRVLMKFQHSVTVTINDFCFGDFVSSFSSVDEIQDLKEGIVGAYAMKGRRNAMEDRFNVIQKADVGRGKKLSFFAIYDGHGGQFVADFVNRNLFMSIIENIRKLHKEKDETKNVTAAVNKENKLITGKPSTDSKENISSNLKLPTDDVKILALQTISQENDSLLSFNSSENDARKKGNNDQKKKEENQKETETICEVVALEIGNKVEDIMTKPKELQKNNSEKDDEPPQSMKDDPYTCLSLLKSKKKLISSSSCKGPVTVAKSLVKNVENIPFLYIDVNSNVNYSKLLVDQILEIDKKVVDICKSKVDFSGTTAVTAVLDEDMLIVGNVGDSRAVMGDRNGATIPLSFDHKPNQLKESRRIKEAGGFITFTGVWRVAGVLATSRALGDFLLKDPKKLITAEPDVLTFSLREHKAEFVILATDGLWDVVTNEEAVEFIHGHIDEHDHGARSLALHAYDKGSQDNITVMVLDFRHIVAGRNVARIERP